MGFLKPERSDVLADVHTKLLLGETRERYVGICCCVFLYVLTLSGGYLYLAEHRERFRPGEGYPFAWWAGKVEAVVNGWCAV